jgi:hypothetical protein
MKRRNGRAQKWPTSGFQKWHTSGFLNNGVHWKIVGKACFSVAIFNIMKGKSNLLIFLCESLMFSCIVLSVIKVWQSMSMCEWQFVSNTCFRFNPLQANANGGLTKFVKILPNLTKNTQILALFGQIFTYFGIHDLVRELDPFANNRGAN